MENEKSIYPDDGYIHLEYRYNDMNDVTDYVAHSIVSFKLEDMGVGHTDKKGLKIRINSAVNGEKVITIDYKDLQTNKSIAALPCKMKERIN